MSEDNYKFKYIKYKKKYIELKKIQENLDNIANKIIILPNEYNMLNNEDKIKFEIYETDKYTSNPISYIKKDYLKTLINKNNSPELETTSNKEEDFIMEKKIITPDEYFILSDSNKSKYEINESDYNKFPNRVVPKNYKKINL
jgi:hypothetical protein